MSQREKRLQTLLVNAMQMYAEEMLPRSESDKKFWKKFLEQVGTTPAELEKLGIDVAELMEVSY